MVALAPAVVVTFGIGAAFGVVAAIAVVGVAGFASEIGDMQFFAPGRRSGTKLWVSDADSGSSRSGTCRARRFPERVGPAGAS